MSDEKKIEVTTEQQKAIISKMFKAVGEDLGAIMRILTQQPVQGGFLLDSEAVGIAQLRLGRAKGAIDKLYEVNNPKPADDALIGGFAPAPAASQTAAFAGGQKLSAVGNAIMETAAGVASVAQKPFIVSGGEDRQ